MFNEQELKIEALSCRIRQLEEALEPFAAIGRKQHYREMGGAYEKAAKVMPVPLAQRPPLALS